MGHKELIPRLIKLFSHSSGGLPIKAKWRDAGLINFSDLMVRNTCFNKGVSLKKWFVEIKERQKNHGATFMIGHQRIN